MNLYNAPFAANFFDGKVIKTEKGFSWQVQNYNITISASEDVEGKPFETLEEAKEDFKRFNRMHCVSYGFTN